MPRKEKGAAEAAPYAFYTQQMVSSTLLAVVSPLAISRRLIPSESHSGKCAPSHRTMLSPNRMLYYASYASCVPEGVALSETPERMT